MQPTSAFLLHRAFGRQATRTPRAPAVQDRGRTVSYGELARRADVVEARLRQAGVRSGSPVGLYAERSVEAVAGMLGILQSGAAVIPLSPTEPAPRLDELLAFARIQVVVDTADTSFPAPASWLGVTIRSDNRPSYGDDLPGRFGSREAESDAGDPAAFILRSSGSTSKPKLIVRTHGSFAHRLNWTWERHPFEAGEVGCQKAPLSTTHAVYELFEPLLRGAPVLLVPEDDVRRVERFWETLRTAGVTRLLMVPSALRTSLDLPHFAPPPLRVLVLMGEYVSPKLAEKAVRTFPSETQLYSIYGSTEASSTLVCDLRASLRPGAELPLGVPLSPAIRTRILDPFGRPVAGQGGGRLYISGPPLFREYLGDKGRTSAVLVDLGEDQGIFYDTRDDVRVDAEGQLLFIGRADHTVKIRGFRVDLQEVERALLQHPGVTQAVAVARGVGAASPRLDAWIAPSTVDPSAVFGELRKRLPEYMIPASVNPVDRFPLTTSGKVDRRRLSDVETSLRPRLAHDEGVVGSGDAVINRIVSAWEQVLGHRRFDLTASFFEVGGTSLTATRAVQVIRTALDLQGDEIDELFLYRFPSVTAQADALEQLRRSVAGQPLPSGQSPLLVTLRAGQDRALPPLFLLPPGGGTAGVYERLTHAMKTRREVVGVRDPFLWGERDIGLPFNSWAGLYVEAIRSRQPFGPYHLAAYSSAGAFGIEVARQLVNSGDEIGLLVLIDPLGLDRPHPRTFGYWASKATYASPIRRGMVRLAGLARGPVRSALERMRNEPLPNTHAPSPDEIEHLTGGALRSRGQTLAMSALLELNTGRPVALFPEELESAGDEPFQMLLRRTADAGLEVVPEELEQIMRQYPVQVWAQHRYRLHTLSVPTLLVEPKTRYQGLVRANLLPFFSHLDSIVLSLGEPSERVARICERFGAWAPHFRCIRDDRFVTSLARTLDTRLDEPSRR